MSALSISCPACGAPVPFQSRTSVFSVCPFCAQMLVRRDLDVQAIGKMALLPEDSSPLQIGTSGKFEGVAFTLAGRIRQRWAEGNWNEWFLVFENGKQGWLGEAQGFYMISFEAGSPNAAAPTTPDHLQIGKSLTFNNVSYEIDDVKEVECVGAQGELPFQSAQGRKSTSVDLNGPNQAYGCLDYSNEGIRLSIGKYADFDELSFQNLRQIDGW